MIVTCNLLSRYLYISDMHITFQYYSTLTQEVQVEVLHSALQVHEDTGCCVMSSNSLCKFVEGRQIWFCGLNKEVSLMVIMQLTECVRIPKEWLVSGSHGFAA